MGERSKRIVKRFFCVAVGILLSFAVSVQACGEQSSLSGIAAEENKEDDPVGSAMREFAPDFDFWTGLNFSGQGFAADRLGDDSVGDSVSGEVHGQGSAVVASELARHVIENNVERGCFDGISEGGDASIVAQELHVVQESNNIPVFISLGKDCESSLHLKCCGLRKEAFPFDWNKINSFTDICRIIENRFINFISPVLLQHNGSSIMNTFYNIEFCHDFPVMSQGNIHIPDTDAVIYIHHPGMIVDNFLDYVDDVAQKYIRRIDRFLKMLDTATRIIFIRTGNTTIDEIKQFTSHMSSHYPLVQYTLLVVHRNNSLNYDWQIPYVRSHYLTTIHPKQNHALKQWADPEEWNNLFINLGYLT